MNLLSWIFAGPAHRRATVVIGLAVVTLALAILAIGANSPYTHANLNPRYDPRYTRTAQIGVGDEIAFSGPSPDPSGNATDPGGRGNRLFVTKGCAACHTLEGRGGVVGPPIVGTDLETLQKKTRKGPGGMPRFSATALTDDELAAIAAFLTSLPAPTN